MKKISSIYISRTMLVIVALALTGCSVFAPPAPPTPTVTQTPLPTETPLPPTQTSLPPTPIPPTLPPPPTEPPLPTNTPVPPEPSATAVSQKAILIYFIQAPKGKNPQCSEGKLVYVNTGIALTSCTVCDIKLALQRLFAYKAESFGTLYNPLAKSAISVESVDTSESSLVVQLSGQYVKEDDTNKCVGIWAKNMVWKTIQNITGPGFIVVMLNSSHFQDISSGR